MKFLSVFERHAIDEAAKEAARKARIEGESAILTRQLIRRFGPLPASIETRLASADQQQLEHWADRILDAASLDEVFG